MADRKSTDRASHQDIIEAAKRDHGALKEQIHVYGEPPLNSFVPPKDKKTFGASFGERIRSKGYEIKL
ncbi:hypothetical protein KKG46_04830 [Patescibacteria group bacterium]|nr:hypothetical protein [Patescibacteria group bacterium]